MDFWKPLSKLRAIFGYIHTCPPPKYPCSLVGVKSGYKYLHGSSHSSLFSFFFVLQEGSQTISRCCYPLWLNIQTKSVCDSVCVLLWGWSFPPVSLSLPPAALPKNALHPVGWQGRPTNTMHTPHCGADVYPCTFFLFSSSCFVLVLERSRGKQAARTFSCWSWCRRRWVQRAEGGCISVSNVSLRGINTCEWMCLRGSAGQFALTEGLKTW